LDDRFFGKIDLKEVALAKIKTLIDDNDFYELAVDVMKNGDLSEEAELRLLEYIVDQNNDNDELINELFVDFIKNGKVWGQSRRFAIENITDLNVLKELVYSEKKERVYVVPYESERNKLTEYAQRYGTIDLRVVALARFKTVANDGFFNTLAVGIVNDNSLINDVRDYATESLGKDNKYLLLDLAVNDFCGVHRSAVSRLTELFKSDEEQLNELLFIIAKSNRANACTRSLAIFYMTDFNTLEEIINDSFDEYSYPYTDTTLKSCKADLRENAKERLTALTQEVYREKNGN
jgi:hypothetical protein